MKAQYVGLTMSPKVVELIDRLVDTEGIARSRAEFIRTAAIEKARQIRNEEVQFSK